MTAAAQILLEACVDSVVSARNAEAGGARRLELCANLVEGGTTPSIGMLAGARDAVGIPIFVLVRPRGGDFLYGADEIRVILRDIAEMKARGADAVVIGALDREGQVDRNVIGRLIEAARPLAVTFHRAFDLARDPIEALETLIELGIERVLTSGQAPTAEQGIPLLRELVQRAEGRIVLLAGGGVNASNARRIVEETGVRELHLRGSRTEPSPMRWKREHVPMGKPYQPDEYCRTETDAAAIRAVLEAV
ncbi:MAG: copper homeostasis protein CutC [Gemmatimonadales bacterium]|nr:copper homeostasis protein CutC [Gemmatimonadales bacterium]